MSDSSNEPEIVNETAFDAGLHLREICKGGSVTLNTQFEVEYQRGWSKIVEELIGKIWSLPVEITSAEDSYGQLELSFNFLKKAHEVDVWRAINDAQKLSRYTCMECGGRGKPKAVRDKVIVTCNYCIEKAEKQGITGTWLDKY